MWAINTRMLSPFCKLTFAILAPNGTSVFANVSCTRKGRLMHW
jgi:hypothetical protein